MSFLGFFKYVLFIYNFIVMLFGGMLLGLAVYFYVDTLQYIDVNARTWPIYSTFFILIIGIGLLTFITGFFGCCGACKESSCMLCVYFTIIVALCSLVGALIFLPEKFELKPQQIKLDLQHDIEKIIQKSYSRYNTTSFANILIDRIQNDFQCCGSNNYTDWFNSLQNNATRPDIGVGIGATSYIVANAFSNNPRPFGMQPQQQSQQSYQSQALVASSPTVTTTFRVPESCCTRQNNDASYNQCRAMIARYDALSVEQPQQQLQRIPNVNSDGCVDKVHHYLFVVHWWPLNIAGGLAIGLQGLSLIFSFCLCCAINRAVKDYDEYEDDR